MSLILSKVFEAKINDVCLFKSLKPHFRQQEFFERSKKMKKESYSQIPLVILLVVQLMLLLIQLMQILLQIKMSRKEVAFLMLSTLGDLFT